MSSHGRALRRILSGLSDANIRFAELRQALLRLGFEERIKGDHHIFTRHDVEEILNLQPKHDKAKPYQVKQVREMILNHRIGGEDVD